MAAFDSDQWSTGNDVQQPAYPGGGVAIGLFGTIEIAIAHSINDTINMFKFPNGFTPLFGYLYGDDLDTNTASEVLELDVGLGTIDGTTITVNDSTYFIDSDVINGAVVTDIKPEVSIWLPLGGSSRLLKPTQLGENRVCVVTVTAAASTGGTGTLTVLIVGLNRDPRVGL